MKYVMNHLKKVAHMNTEVHTKIINIEKHLKRKFPTQSQNKQLRYFTVFHR